MLIQGYDLFQKEFNSLIKATSIDKDSRLILFVFKFIASVLGDVVAFKIGAKVRGEILGTIYAANEIFKESYNESFLKFVGKVFKDAMTV